MKRFWIVLALLTVLCGCDGKTPEQTESAPVQTTVRPTEEATEPVAEDPGLYVPGSDVEQQSGGAVRPYRVIGENVLDVIAAEDRLVVFSGCSTGKYVSVLTGDNCVVEAQGLLSGCMSTEAGTVRVTENSLVYYDGGSRSVVFLDKELKEKKRLALPEQVTGAPVISEDLCTVFYCVENKLHALDVTTGISRLIRQQSCQWQNLQGSFFGDTVLQCNMIDENMQAFTCFLSAETGQLLGQDEALLRFFGSDERFFLIRQNGCLPEYLFGDEQGQVQTLTIPQTAVYSVLDCNAVVGAQIGEEGTRMFLYDLRSGSCTAQTLLSGIEGVYDVTADPAGRYIWISVYDREAQQDMLYRWDYSLSPQEDPRIYTGKRYTREDPDVQGLAECKQKAQSLADTYGVKILLGEDVISPWDYTLTTEYRVEALELGLAQLETALAAYPEEFLTTMVEQTDSGILCISLVRDISQDVDGVQYWIEGDACIALKMCDTMEQDMYHEVSHVLDNFIIANCYAYDDWEKLNPEGAVYDYNYSDYRDRTDWTWLEGEQRAFIDSYSMSYPKEDRARILEYAMTAGNEELFRSEYLQGKLLKICKGIRESFGYERYEGTFLWEQYLETSLAYTKKK